MTKFINEIIEMLNVVLGACIKLIIGLLIIGLAFMIVWKVLQVFGFIPDLSLLKIPN